MTLRFPPAVLPFLPCVDDWRRLLILSDAVEEAGDLLLAKHCRAIALVWAHPHTTRRHMVEEGWECWARFASQGWSRAVVERVTPRKITVRFPHRPAKVWSSTVIQTAERAWWDLEPRGEWQGTMYSGKPKPRRGYGTQKNAALAAALCGGGVLERKPVDERSLYDAEDKH